MGRSRIKAAVIALFAAALVAAPGAFSATPQEIYRDYADNGQLDEQYSPADLERVLKNAAVQQYGPGTVGGGLKPEVEEEIDEAVRRRAAARPAVRREDRRAEARRLSSRAVACRSPGSISV